jgi:hypothetical protein
MAYSISQANADLTGILHGTNLNKITGLTNLHNRTARQLLADLDPQETIRKSITTTPIFSQVWDYACPSDLKSNRIIDIAPQYTRLPSQVITQTYNQPFDIDKNKSVTNPEFTIQFNNGIKSVRINDTSLPQGTVIDTCEATDGWTASATASNLSEDNVNFASGSGSLSFDVTTGIGSISKTLASQLDLSAQINQSSLFYYLYLPSGPLLTSTEIRWGSSASDYYSRTLTTTNEGTAFQTGWNLIRADWNGASITGSPTVTAINYIYIGVTVASNQTGIKVDNIVSTMGMYRTIEYYSKFLFRNANSGAFQETTTDISDLINLDTESYNVYLALLAFYATQQVQGVNALSFDGNFWGQEYLKLVQRYTSLNKSQVQKPRQNYYTQVKAGFGKYLGRRWGL